MPVATISATEAELIAQNKLRVSFIIQNEDLSINAFIKFEEPGATTVSTTDHDHRIGPGGSLALNKDTDGLEQVQQRITIIAASGNPLISFFETENDPR